MAYFVELVSKRNLTGVILQFGFQLGGHGFRRPYSAIPPTSEAASVWVPTLRPTFEKEKRDTEGA